MNRPWEIRRSGRHARGFTIVELMVVLAIAPIVAFGLLTLHRTMIDDARWTTSVSDFDTKVATIQSWMQRDLRGARQTTIYRDPVRIVIVPHSGAETSWTCVPERDTCALVRTTTEGERRTLLRGITECEIDAQGSVWSVHLQKEFRGTNLYDVHERSIRVVAPVPLEAP